MEIEAAIARASQLLAEPYERAMRKPREPQVPREEAAALRRKVTALADKCADPRKFWERLAFTMNLVDPYPTLDRKK